MQARSHGKDSFDTNNHLGAGFQKVPRSLSIADRSSAIKQRRTQNARGKKERMKEGNEGEVVRLVAVSGKTSQSIQG